MLSGSVPLVHSLPNLSEKSWFNFKDGSAQKVKSLLIALCPFLIYSKSRTVCKAGVT